MRRAAVPVFTDVLLHSAEGVPVRSAIRPRSTLRTAAALAAGILAACGSARTVGGEVPLCARCHGDAARPAPITAMDPTALEQLRAAPPRTVSGLTATTDLGVGAHEAHVSRTRLRGPIPCSECHVTPADMAAHEAQIAAIGAGTAQRVVFGPVATTGAAGATWDYPAATTCSNTWCHGGPLNQGGTAAAHTPDWIAGGAPLDCTSCHGFPPDPATTAHPTLAGPCASCHSETVRADNTIIVDPATGASTHIDGHLTLDAGSCSACHGFPPTSGAHAVHTSIDVAAYGSLQQTSDVLPAATTRYAFGCGQCHPLDPAEHDRHFSEGAGVFVTLTPDVGTAGSLRGLDSPAAAATGVTGVSITCSGVYCHSSGQASPTYATTPDWYGTATLGCDGCHANPPRYANGGAGTATANSHVGLLNESGITYESGHFGGFPAAYHDGSYHGVGGGKDSSPITCQTCHFDTTDPTNTGAPGFYYLDTSGSYDLGGTGNFTIGGVSVPAYSCTACHTGTPPAQGGRVRPYFHVNGARDVAFDRRTAITGTPTLPAAPNTPTRPYWLASGNDLSWVATAVGASGGMDGTTVSFDLGAATWDPADKTCSSVACHFNRTSAQWGEPLSAAPSTGTCTICHNN